MPRRLLTAGSEQQVLSAHGGVAAMPSAFQLQCHLVLILLAASKGDTRYLEVSNAESTPRCTSPLSANFIHSLVLCFPLFLFPLSLDKRLTLIHTLAFHSFTCPFLDLVLLAKEPSLSVWGSPLRGWVTPHCSSSRLLAAVSSCTPSGAGM